MARIEVESEVTGRIWKIVTESGTKVSEGDTLLILESMKMEIPVVATVAGTLKEMRVSEEDRISEGDVVAVIEPT